MDESAMYLVAWRDFIPGVDSSYNRTAISVKIPYEDLSVFIPWALVDFGVSYVAACLYIRDPKGRAIEIWYDRDTEQYTVQTPRECIWDDL